MRWSTGLPFLLLAGCLDLNPEFVEPLTTGGETTESPPTTGVAPTTMPPTTMPQMTMPSTTTEETTTEETAATGVMTVDPPDTDGSGGSMTMPVGVCGDGVVGPGESCDDGNAVDDDKCRNDCTYAACGDGVVNGDEDCDDANMSDDDACVGCRWAECGDGFVQAGVEGCDDGNPVPTDECVNCQAAKCGDGVVQAGKEECEDGNMMGNDGCEPNCQKTVKYVFVTSNAYKGNLGGLKGANDACIAAAKTAGLVGIPFVAWLSDSQQSPKDFIIKSPFPYVNLKKQMVAKDGVAFFSGQLMLPIDLTETGGKPPVTDGCAMYGVHTNTTYDGKPVSLIDHCGNWYSSAGATTWGVATEKNAMWTNGCTADLCGVPAPIYCVQQ